MDEIHSLVYKTNKIFYKQINLAQAIICIVFTSPPLFSPACTHSIKELQHTLTAFSNM